MKLVAKVTHGKMLRRSFVAGLLAIPVVGCADSEVAAVRYRVIATVEVDHKLVEANTVMEVKYVRVKNSLSGAGGATKLSGEALIFDLPGGRTFYILLYERGRYGSISQMWEVAVLRSIGIDSSVGGLSDRDLSSIKAASGRFRLNYYGRLPTFVAFTDEKDPKTIFEVNPANLADTFWGAHFKGIEIEIVDDPVTNELRKRLPWLDAGRQVFERDPPGAMRSSDEKPIGYVITRAHFFGDGSRSV